MLLTDIQFEMWKYYKSHPEHKRELFAALPDTPIHRDTAIPMSIGFGTASSMHAEVRANIDATKQRMDADTAERYDFRAFLRENRQVWRERCASVADGDEGAVPFSFDWLISTMDVVAPFARVAGLMKSRL